MLASPSTTTFGRGSKSGEAKTHSYVTMAPILHRVSLSDHTVDA